jgi:prophage regulatory protein
MSTTKRQSGATSSTKVLQKQGVDGRISKEVGRRLQTHQYQEKLIMDYSKKLLRLEQVIERVAHSKSTIYRGMGNGSFPRPIRLGSRMVRWVSGDIDTYLSNLSRTV